MGNLFSVRHAFAHVGVPAIVTSSREELLNSDAVVLPGVGAFGDAMTSLRRLDLVGPLHEVAASDKLLVGICLGMQLLMTESCEFGTHRGLDIIPGVVSRLSPSVKDGSTPKVPHIGWSPITATVGLGLNGRVWEGSPLDGVLNEEYMYFVHSYYARPDDPSKVLSMSRYEDVEFCSSIWRGNIFACQFHPERSGTQGLRVYGNLASVIARRRGVEIPAD